MTVSAGVRCAIPVYNSGCCGAGAGVTGFGLSTRQPPPRQAGVALRSCPGPGSAWPVLLFDCECEFGGFAYRVSGSCDAAEYVPGVLVAAQQTLLDVFDDASDPTFPVYVSEVAIVGSVYVLSGRDVVEPVVPFELFDDGPGQLLVVGVQQDMVGCFPHFRAMLVFQRFDELFGCGLLDEWSAEYAFLVAAVPCVVRHSGQRRCQCSVLRVCFAARPHSADCSFPGVDIVPVRSFGSLPLLRCPAGSDDLLPQLWELFGTELGMFRGFDDLLGTDAATAYACLLVLFVHVLLLLAPAASFQAAHPATLPAVVDAVS